MSKYRGFSVKADYTDLSCVDEICAKTSDFILNLKERKMYIGNLCKAHCQNILQMTCANFLSFASNQTKCYLLVLNEHYLRRNQSLFSVWRAQLSEPSAAITIDNWEQKSSDWIRFEPHVNLLLAQSGWGWFNKLSFCPQNVSTSSRWRRPLSASREERTTMSLERTVTIKIEQQSLLGRVWSFSVVF